jgi:hypothetical protein
MKFTRQLRCSFCCRGESQVAKLVAGPRGYICDACVETAARIMAEAGDGPHTTASRQTFAQRLRCRFAGAGGTLSGTHLQSTAWSLH